MKRTLLALGVAVGLAVAVGAAERPEKKKPADAKSYDEGTKAFPVGEKMTVNVVKHVPQTVVRTVRIGNEVKTETVTVLVPVTESVVVVVPARKWTLGAEGWHDKEGFNVDKTATDGPLAKVRTLDGNKESFRKIEPNDVIAKIDGRPVTSELNLYLAIQGAAAPEKLSLEVISAKDGTTYTGTVAATSGAAPVPPPISPSRLGWKAAGGGGIRDGQRGPRLGVRDRRRFREEPPHAVARRFAPRPGQFRNRRRQPAAAALR